MSLEDAVWRSYGVLKYARSLGESEVLELISKVRLGLDLGRRGCDGFCLDWLCLYRRWCRCGLFGLCLYRRRRRLLGLGLCRRGLGWLGLCWRGFWCRRYRSCGLGQRRFRLGLLCLLPEGAECCNQGDCVDWCFHFLVPFSRLFSSGRERMRSSFSVPFSVSPVTRQVKRWPSWFIDTKSLSA